MKSSSFPYDQAQYEQIPCDLCGSSDFHVLAKKDRNRLKVQTCLCTCCGLIYLSPRMTKGWYDRYYQEEYRAQMARFKGMAEHQSEKEDLSQLFQQATRHGSTLATLAQPHLRSGLTIEVGSSVGGVLNGFRQVLKGEVLGIEPSPSEAAYANRQGISTHATLMENFSDQAPSASNILCVQSLNHLLSPRYFMSWAYHHLGADGRLMLEVMNFRHVFRQFNCMRRAIQIDHTFMFVPEVLRHFVIAAGFDVLWMENDEELDPAKRREQQKAGLPGYHVRLVASKSTRLPFAALPEMGGIFERTLSSLQSIQDSPWRYFLRYELKYMLRRMKNRLRAGSQPAHHLL